MTYMDDKLLDFLKLLDKMLKFPQMSLTEKETILIKAFLSQVLDNNPNYGPHTKQLFKAMLEATTNPIELRTRLIEYITSHDVRI